MEKFEEVADLIPEASEAEHRKLEGAIRDLLTDAQTLVLALNEARLWNKVAPYYDLRPTERGLAERIHNVTKNLYAAWSDFAMLRQRVSGWVWHREAAREQPHKESSSLELDTER